MHRSFPVTRAFALVSFIFAFFTLPVTAPASTPSIAIPVVLTQSVSSYTAKAGDPFSFRTSAPVHLGSLNVPTGTAGRGIVTTSTHAKGTHGGALVLEPRTLDVFGGTPITVTLAPGENSVSRKTRAHIFPFPVPLGPVLVFGAAVNRAKDITYPTGTAFFVTPVRSPVTAPSS